MSLPMVHIDGVPDRSDLKPGMAFFAGTGPEKTTCGGCKHRGYYRQSQNARWSEHLQRDVHTQYRVQKCGMVKKMTGHHGQDVAASNPSCKYFEAKLP